MKKASVSEIEDLELVDLSDVEEDEEERKLESRNIDNKAKTASRIALSSIVSKGDAITTKQAIVSSKLQNKIHYLFYYSLDFIFLVIYCFKKILIRLLDFSLFVFKKNNLSIFIIK
jgi:hypothetical protein